MLLAEPEKASYESMHSENCDTNLEGRQREGRVQQLVKKFENLKVLSETRKIEIKGTHKSPNKKDDSKGGTLGQENLKPNGQENLKPNGCVERCTTAGMDRPLAKRQPNILSGNNCGSFDHHCNMAKYKDGGSSDISDTQSLDSAAPSESSSGRRRRSTKQRGEMKEQQFMKNIQEKMNEEEKRRIPIAQGLPWTIDEPQVVPKPPVKEHTKPLNVKLRTESRALERAKFDHLMEEKIHSFERQKSEEQRLWKVAEEEEIQSLRKEMIPYAQLMPSFHRPFIPKKSSKSPTISNEPKFHRNHYRTKSLSEEQRLWKVSEEEEIQSLRKETIPHAQLMPSFDRPFIPKKSSKSPTISKEPKFNRNHYRTKSSS